MATPNAYDKIEVMVITPIGVCFFHADVALQCPSVSKPFNVIASSLSLPLPLPFPPQGLLPSRVGYSGQNHAHVQRPRWLCGIPVDRKTDRLHEVEYHGGLD